MARRLAPASVPAGVRALAVAREDIDEATLPLRFGDPPAAEAVQLVAAALRSAADAMVTIRDDLA